MKFKKIKAAAAAVMMTSSMIAASVTSAPVYAKYGTGSITLEHLDRGICAVNTGSGMLVSWRFNADDPDNAVFKLYRDNNLIYTSDGTKATSYLDKSGNSTSQYKVETLSGSTVLSTDICNMISSQSYFDLPLDVPKGGSDYGYRANDCSVGDVDGDGQYEIFVKWDPTNSQDNSKSGYTGNVYVDCYTLQGKKLWRVDLGKNIRAGAHYTQYLVADFDLDGKAEMTCKTADGTVDGKGKVIGDASKDYRNSGGYILSGPEYYTLFDGATGAALDTVNYEYPRGEVSKSTWGDNYGNRCDRFLGTVACLDGVHPSAVSFRGYYTRMTAVAYDVVNKKLVKRWGYDSGWSWTANSGYGNGNHNCMPGDVDGDGKDEIFVGAVCLDDNGKVLWSNNMGHGDAMHLSDFLPDRPGLEAWVCHEHVPYGQSLLDAKTGEKIFHMDASKDTGRCAAGNVYAGNPGAEFWGAASGDVFDGNGKTLGIQRPSMNFLIYWDGDLERELLDGTTISKVNASKKIDYLLWAENCESCNSTKSTPNLSADIFGDWREELILHTTDSKYLRIYCTPYTTEYRITTLMHDPQYRMQTATEQNCYNQPPHTSFYLGSDKPLPERPNVTVLGGTEFSIPDGKLIKSLDVYDKTNRYSWSVQSGLVVGNEVFGDRSCKFTSVPEKLSGAEWVRTSCDSKKYNGDEAVFTAAEDISVYVGVDTRAETSCTWLAGWTKTDMTLTDDGNPNVTYALYKKDVKKDSQVTLGAVNMNQAVNYVVIATEQEPSVTPPVTPDTPETSDFAYGDINNDGRVNIFDMTFMRSELTDNKLDRSAKKRADVDANGKVEISDAVQLQKYIMTGKSFTAVTEKRMFVYAVDQTYSEGIEENTNAGYRDTAYVNLENKTGSNITWNINAPIDGNYLCTFGIANGSSDNRKMKIEVNGQKDFWVQDFLSTGAWTNWEERGIVLPLKKGSNTILMTSFTEQGGPNLDYMHIEWTDEPIAQIYEEEIVTPPEPSDVSRTIYIAGDSTVQTYKASYAPQQGWGAFLGENMPEGTTVSNHAIAGRSSKSFYDNGRLDTILGSIQQNDYLLIQFGINDSAASKPERYAPTCGSVPGTDGSFEYYMAKYIEGAKSKGATPVLVTTVIGLKSYDSNSKKFTGSYQNYCNAMKQLAAYYNIPCIDLNSLMVNHYNSIGYDAAYQYHMCSTGSTDMTHFTETGAKAVAKLVADEMKKQGLC